MPVYCEGLLLHTLKYLDLGGGFNPLNFKIALCIPSVISVMVITFLTACLIIFGESDMKIIVDVILSISMNAHMLLKMTTLIMHHERIKSLIRATDDFWPISESKDVIFQNSCNGFLKTVQTCFKIYLFFCVLSISSCAITAILYGNLAFMCYVPPFVNRWIFVIFNNAVFNFACLSALGFDLFFAIWILMLGMQFKIFNKVLNEAKFVEMKDSRQMARLIDHHDFLLGCVRNLNRVYGSIMFLFMWAQIGLICMLLYVVSQAEEDTGVVMKNAAQVWCVSLEIFLAYSLPGQYLTSEASETMNSIYFSNWRECHSINVRKALVMMMTRCQREVTVKADKMLPLTFEGCTFIFRKSFSFFTFLLNVKEKKMR